MQDAGATVVGVSTDPPEKAERFRRELDLPFPVVGDPSGTVARDYRVRWPIIGWARRVTYVIGSDGVILGVYHSERSVLEHAEQALRFLPRRGPA